jgi:hypothetical protein
MNIRGTISALTLSLACLAPASAFAQSAAAAPKGDIAVSYSVLHDSDLSTTLGVGWVFSGARNVSSVLGIVGEAGGNYKTIQVLGTDLDISVHSFLGGVRLRAQNASKAVPFAQVLTGMSRASASVLGESEASNAFTIQPGAGVDIQLRERMSLRAQGDFRILRSNGENSNEFRVAVGLAFGLGR